MKHLSIALALLMSLTVFADDPAPTPASTPDYTDVLTDISTNLTATTQAIVELKTRSDANTIVLTESISNLTVKVSQALNDLKTSMNNSILIPTPDYNSKMEVESGYVAAAKGFIMMTTKETPRNGYKFAYINDVRVFIPLTEKAAEFDCVHYGIYPVAEGDRITLPTAEKYIKIFWVPAK